MTAEVECCAVIWERVTEPGLCRYDRSPLFVLSEQVFAESFVKCVREEETEEKEEKEEEEGEREDEGRSCSRRLNFISPCVMISKHRPPQTDRRNFTKTKITFNGDGITPQMKT